jgi:hypothetical protein
VYIKVSRVQNSEHKVSTEARHNLSAAPYTTLKMKPSGLILGLLVAVHVAAHPIDRDHSSFVLAKTPDYTDYTTTAEIVTRDQPTENMSVQPRGATSTQPGTQSCHCTNHWTWNSYNVLIGIPYQSASACDNTYHLLESWVAISNWQCVENNGNTQLYFNAGIWQNGNINNGLNAAYPNVAGGFNCPDE